MSTIRLVIRTAPFLSCIGWLTWGQTESQTFVYIRLDPSKHSLFIKEVTEEYMRQFQIPAEFHPVPGISDAALFRIQLSKLQQLKDWYLPISNAESMRFEFRQHTLTVYQGKRSIVIPVERIHADTKIKTRNMVVSSSTRHFRPAFAMGQWTLTNTFRETVEQYDKPTIPFQVRDRHIHCLGFRQEMLADSEFRFEIKRDNLLRFFHGLQFPCTVFMEVTEVGPVRFRTLEASVMQEIEITSIQPLPIYVPNKRAEQSAESGRKLLSALTYMASLLQEPMPMNRALWGLAETGTIRLASGDEILKVQAEIPFPSLLTDQPHAGYFPEEVTSALCQHLQSAPTADWNVGVKEDTILIQGMSGSFTGERLEEGEYPFPATGSNGFSLTLGKACSIFNRIENRRGQSFVIESNDGWVQIRIDSWVMRKKHIPKPLPNVVYHLPYETVRSFIQVFADTDAVIRIFDAQNPFVCFSAVHEGVRFSAYLASLSEPSAVLEASLAGDSQGSIPTEDPDRAQPENREKAVEALWMKRLLEMESWIGLEPIKQQCIKLVKYVEYERRRQSVIQAKEMFPTLHMCFTGNPGTGKTMTARMLGKVLKDIGILSKGHVVEVDRQSLIGQHIGQSEANFAKYLKQAQGGILFIDEAHSLYKPESSKDYGHDLIHVLVKTMEDYRDSCIFILAGYPNEMKAFLDSNIGLRDRIPFHFSFPDYTTDELIAIGRKMAKDRYHYTFGPGVEDVLRQKIENARVDETFGNARLVRNLVEQAVIQHAARAGNQMEPDYFTVLMAEDFVDANGHSEHLQTVWEQLDQLVGLQEVKQMLRRLQDVLLHDRQRAQVGYSPPASLMHMCFIGNPGTGKTTVARLTGRLLKEMGLLKRGHLVEVTAKDLIAPYVGQSVHKTAGKIREALGGILFIDEAYVLTKGGMKPFGEEVIATLVKEMDAQREHLVVILAGYPDAMQELLQSNPGLHSRIRFHISFPDYTASELVEIFLQKAEQAGYIVPADVQEALWESFIASTSAKDVTFGNGRLAEITFEHARMALAARTRDDWDTPEACVTFCREDLPNPFEQ
jgi:AAA+ superfamily predicted ATPase